MGRQIPFIQTCFGVVILFIAGGATAAEISMLEVSAAGGNATVNLDNWGWQNPDALEVFADESWMSYGEYAIDVDLIGEDPGRGGLLTIPTDFRKTVTNLTSFVWTGFTTTIIPSPGGSIASVMAQPNVHFGNVIVVDNGNGSFSIDWDNLGNNGTGVAINSMATFNFSFDVTGPSGELVNYKIRQIPTPEPASVLLIMTGFVLTRRRRRLYN